MSRGASQAKRRRAEQVHLLDGNVLVALVGPSHVHHQAAERWFAANAAPFATCPITQGTLLRLLMHLGGLDTERARDTLQRLTAHPRHRFWPDAIGCADIAWQGVIGPPTGDRRLPCRAGPAGWSLSTAASRNCTPMWRLH